MSFRIDGVGDYAQRTGSANLGSATSATFLVWFRKEGSTVDRDIAVMTKPGKAVIFRDQSSTQVKGGVNFGTFVNQSMALNSWAGLALRTDGSNWDTLFYQSGVLTVVHSESSYSGDPIGNITLGNNDAWGDSAAGCLRYARFWTAALSNAEIQAEFEMTPSGGMPAARLTNLFDSWLLPTGTDGSGVNSNSLTLSGGATSAEEPTIGGGAVVAAGILRSTPARPQGVGIQGLRTL